MDGNSGRWTLSNLPLPAKLVITVFLLSVGLGYLSAMIQLHFKHATPGNVMPMIPDLVARFSGKPWPLEPKPAEDAGPSKSAAKDGADGGPMVAGVKVKTILKNRCVCCHGADGEKDDAPFEKYEQLASYLKPTTSAPKGHLYATINGSRTAWNKNNMSKAFFEKSEGWEGLTAEQRKAEEPKRAAEQAALSEWIEAGAPQSAYDADAFALPDPVKFASLDESLRTQAKPLTPADRTAPPRDKWKEAKARQLSPEALTQSTHAHLLSFSMLWALTGLVFAFTNYRPIVRCVVAPVVLIAQIADISCWWLARLDGPGPYFAIMILATGGLVGMGLGAQITLSLWNMWNKGGRLVLIVLALIGAGAGGLVFMKVIDPQIQAEKELAAKG